MGARVKTILSAVATASAGLSGKAVADFYAGQTQATIAARMESLRASVWAEQNKYIIGSYTYDEYSIETAWAGLTGYFYAGTPVAALMDINQESGTQKKTANDKLNNTPSPPAADTKKQIAKGPSAVLGYRTPNEFCRS